MNLDEKIGQLFVVPARAGAPIGDLLRHVRDNHVGGVIWFLSTCGETARVNEELQSIARIPLLISADLEAGAGMRFTDAVWWPPPMAIAATGDPAYARVQGRATARDARAIGVQHILAPVADVNVDPRNPVINTRSFGEDPHLVAKYVAAFIEGVQDEGSLATAKHFPGHGDTHVDSHRSLPVLSVTRERLDAVELVPFRAAIEAGVGSVMIGHLAVPALDDTEAPVREAFENVYGTHTREVPLGGTLPATVSRRVIVDLLRSELGFHGLVITDAMDMGGLAAHFDPAEAAVRAIEAGNDQILYSADTDAAIAGVRDAVMSGRVPQARIDESVERIMEAKRRVRAVSQSSPLSPRQPHRRGERVRVRGRDQAATLAPHPNPLPAPPPSPAGRGDAFSDIATDLARSSITLVRDTNHLLPLRATNVAVIAVSPHDDPLDDALLELGAQSAVDEADVIVLLLALRPKSGAGSITVPQEIRTLADRHGAKIIAIAFGSPYILRELGEVSTFVCAWGVQPLLQVAAIEALKGMREMPGTLPVTIA